MSLWVDKHRPRDLHKLDFHKEQAQQLKNIAKQGDFPHLLFFGPPGAGKKTRINCLLKELFGAGVERLRSETMQFTTPSNRKVDIMTVSSNYHIEVSPSDAGIYDRVVVVELVKEIAQTHQLDSSRPFRVIVLTEVDDLTKDAQHALRRTMEKYVATCRIILCVNSTSRVIPAIRSRCLGIRVPSPTKDEIITVLKNTTKKESLQLPIELAEKIAEKCNGNLRRAILMCETCRVEKYPFSVNQSVTEPDWEVFLRETAKLIVAEQTPAKLEKVRERLYELLAHAIPATIIFEKLVKELVKNCDMQMKAEVIQQAAHYEHRMQMGSKHIFHLEAFVAHFMFIYKKFLSSMMEF